MDGHNSHGFGSIHWNCSCDPITKSPGLQISYIPTTPSNTRAIRHLKQQVLSLSDNLVACVLIDKLANTAMGGLTEGYLGQEWAWQVEAANALKAEESKKQGRTKLINLRAVLGKDLLVKLQQLTLQESPQIPQQTQAWIKSKRKVTFAKKLRKPYVTDPIYLSSISTDELDSESSASACSTIHVATLGTHSSRLPSLYSSGPPSPTPVAPTPNRVTTTYRKANRSTQGSTLDVPEPSGSYGQTIRPRRTWIRVVISLSCMLVNFIRFPVIIRFCRKYSTPW